MHDNGDNIGRVGQDGDIGVIVHRHRHTGRDAIAENWNVLAWVGAENVQKRLDLLLIFHRVKSPA